jgi:hypothetical protein
MYFSPSFCHARHVGANSKSAEGPGKAGRWIQKEQNQPHPTNRDGKLEAAQIKHMMDRHPGIPYATFEDRSAFFLKYEDFVWKVDYESELTPHQKSIFNKTFPRGRKGHRASDVDSDPEAKDDPASDSEANAEEGVGDDDDEEESEGLEDEEEGETSSPEDEEEADGPASDVSLA